MDDSLQRILRYYRSNESRIGYRVVLGGNRHFGYYEPGLRGHFRRFSTAQQAMEQLLIDTLALPAGSRILDAGCGEGYTARAVAEGLDAHVVGIDLLAESIERAREKADADPFGRLTFEEMSFVDLAFDDGSFDGVYTMETLVHAPSPADVLAGYHRVLRPGGTLVMLEYSMPARGDVSEEDYELYVQMNRDAGMDGYLQLVHDGFPALLEGAGFADVTVEDITDRMMPMLRYFAAMAAVPYLVTRAMGRPDRFINVQTAVEGYRHREHFRYNVIRATRP